MNSRRYCTCVFQVERIRGAHASLYVFRKESRAASRVRLIPSSSLLGTSTIFCALPRMITSIMCTDYFFLSSKYFCSCIRRRKPLLSPLLLPFHLHPHPQQTPWSSPFKSAVSLPYFTPPLLQARKLNAALAAKHTNARNMNAVSACASLHLPTRLTSCPTLPSLIPPLMTVFRVNLSQA